MKKRKERPVQENARSRMLQLCTGIIIFLVAACGGCGQSITPDAGLGASEEAAMREVRGLAAAAASLLDVYMDARVTDMLVCSKICGGLREAFRTPEARPEANRALDA